MKKAPNKEPLEPRESIEEGEDRKGEGRQAKQVASGLKPPELKALKRAGHILSIGDLLWLVQAGLMAWCFGVFLNSHLEADGGASEALNTFPLGGLGLFLVALAFVAVSLLRLRLTLMSQNRAHGVALEVKTRLRRDLLAQFSRTPPAAHLPSSGEFAAHMGEQVEAVGPYLSNFFPQKIRLMIVPVGILLATACFSWLAAGILLITGPIIPFFMALIGIRAKSASEAQQAELTRMSGILMDRLRGLETLRLFGAVERSRDEIEAVGNRFRHGTMKVLRIAFLSSTVLELFSALGIAFMAVYIGFSLLGQVHMGTWGPDLAYTTGLFLLLLAPEFYSPLRAYAAAYHDRAAGLAALESLGKLEGQLLEAGTGTPASSEISKVGSRSTIRFASCGATLEADNLTFSQGGHCIFDRLSLMIEGGETTLVVGPSGAGKTTLFDLILGFHRPDEGRLLVGGFDLQTLDHDWWREHISWLGQAPVLFHGSLRSNLLAANANATHHELMAALELAGCEELIARLPRGLDTRIGENGFGLSIGEQRRVALARASLRQDAFLILADEPTAGLDRETADKVIAGLEHLAKGKTLLVATHDEALLKRDFKRLEILPNASEIEREPIAQKPELTEEAAQ